MIKNLNGLRETVEFSINQTIHLYKNAEYEHYPPHWHNAIEITMPLEGVYTYIIGNNKYLLNELDLIIVPSGGLHEIKAPSVGKRLIFLFRFSFFYDNSPFAPLLPLLTNTTVVRNDSSTLHKRVAALFQEMCHEYDVSDVLSEPAIYSKLLQMLIHIRRHDLAETNPFGEESHLKQREYAEKIVVVMQYINSHYKSDIDLDELSNIAGYSKFHFSRIFKQYTGMNHTEYLNQVRIKEAENMLQVHDMPITEIAMNCGFNSISTFNRVFKKVKNYTPSQFKEFLHGKKSHEIHP